MSTLPSAADIARLSLHSPEHFHVQQSQTAHRRVLLSHLPALAGSRVLELGCGQGDMTAVLASAVGEGGEVVAVDPAPLDYGSPYTLGQAQAHLSSSPLGPRIKWVQQTPQDYLAALPPSPGEPLFAAAILAHSLWYFQSPSLVLETLRALKGQCKTLCLAEWSLQGKQTSQQAHVLAALAQASLECRKAETVSNVRTVFSPLRLRALAEEAGWKEQSSAFVTPELELADGRWEVGAVLAKGFEKEVEEHVKDEREKAVVLALKDAVKAAVDAGEGGLKGVRAMDVWVGVFV